QPRFAPRLRSNTSITMPAAAATTGQPTCAFSTRSTQATATKYSPATFANRMQEKLARGESSALVSPTLARAPLPEIPTLLPHEPRQHHHVHFGRAVHQPRGARCAIDPLRDRILREAPGTLELDRHVCGLVQRVGDLNFRHRYFLACAAALIEHPRRMHGE